MIWVGAGLGVLAGAGAFSLLAARRPRLSLLIGMGGIVAGSGLMLVAAMTVLLGSNAASFTGSQLPFGAMHFRLDAVGAWFAVAIAVLSVATAVHSWGYLDAGREPTWAYSGLNCLLVASMFGLVCAADCVAFLVFWELMTLSSFFLIGFHDREPVARRAAWTYLIATHLGTAFFVIPAFAMLWSHAGGPEFDRLASIPWPEGATAAQVVFVLGVLGFGLKAGALPLHIWLPIAHPVAPGPVSALLSGVVVKTGIYGIVRLLSWLPPLPGWCPVALIAAGAVSGVLGVAYALAQHELKRLLAYHTVENIGIILLGLGVGLLGRTIGSPLIETAGYAGALLHVLNHAMFKGLLFLSAAGVAHAAGTTSIDRLGGLARAGRLHAALFLVGALSICGLPPFNGFVSEWLIYGSAAAGAVEGGGIRSPAAAVGFVALAVMGGLALACFAKAFGVIFLGSARDGGLRPHGLPASMLAPMAVLAAICIATGLAAGPVVRIVLEAASAVHGTPAAPLHQLLPPDRVPLAGVVLLTLVGGLTILRALRGRPVTQAAPTWGCGYAAPTARMQYTASAFAWSLVSSARGLVGADRHVEAPAGVLPPAPGRASSHASDWWFEGLFSPIFRGMRRICRMLQTLSWTGEPAAAGARLRPSGPLARLASAIRRRGVHISLTYIILVLLALFAVEAARWTAGQGSAPAAPVGEEAP